MSEGFRGLVHLRQEVLDLLDQALGLSRCLLLEGSVPPLGVLFGRLGDPDHLLISLLQLLDRDLAGAAGRLGSSRRSHAHLHAPW